jgi:hypothetical protein
MTKLIEPGKPVVILPGTVEQIIPENSFTPEEVQISVGNAERLYREIRMENTLRDGNGRKVGLKPGAHVEVTIEARKEETEPKK